MREVVMLWKMILGTFWKRQTAASKRARGPTERRLCRDATASASVVDAANRTSSAELLPKRRPAEDRPDKDHLQLLKSFLWLKFMTKMNLHEISGKMSNLLVALQLTRRGWSGRCQSRDRRRWWDIALWRLFQSKFQRLQRDTGWRCSPGTQLPTIPSIHLKLVDFKLISERLINSINQFQSVRNCNWNSRRNVFWIDCFTVLSEGSPNSNCLV